MAKKSLTDALMLIIGAPKKRSCPECDSPMEADGTCSECGYGESEEEGGEYEEEGEGEDHMMRMTEIRDDLQRIVDKLSKLLS
jgi:uncharacterized Zn finger protein (UPF0148 family)